MKEILDNLTYLSKTSGQTAQVLHNLNLENPLGFGLQLNLALCERIHSQAKSLNLLWGKIIDGEVSIEQSAGILIRSLLLDTMLVLKQSLSIKGEKQSSDVIIKFDEFAKKVLSDGLEGVFKHLEKGKLLGIYDENQIHNAFMVFATEFNALIETYSNDGTIPILRWYTNSLQFFA
jgi:hypothetical protein